MAIYAPLGCSDRARILLYIVASLSRGVEHGARALFEIVSLALQAQETAQVAHSNVRLRLLDWSRTQYYLHSTLDRT